MAFLQRLARRLATTLPRSVALLTAAGPDASGFFILVGGERAPLDVAQHGARVAELLDGRGGGSGAIFQGKAGDISKRSEALQALRELAGGS